MRKDTNKTMISDLFGDLKVTRRSFLKKATAATGSAVALGAIVQPKLRALAQVSETNGSGAGEWKSATCQGCTSWCSKQVYVVDGRAVKVRGNPHSKVNGSAGCPRSHLALQQVYDPDRIKTPMKRSMAPKITRCTMTGRCFSPSAPT